MAKKAKKKRYNHMYAFAFSIVSDDPEGKDVKGDALRKAILAALNRLEDGEVYERCDVPIDTYEEPE